MTHQELFSLLPMITLGSVILVLLIVVAFWRNLRATCVISIGGLALTLGSIWLVYTGAPVQVTPLIMIDGYALLFSALIVMTSAGVLLLSFDYLKHRGEHPDEFFILTLLATLGAMVLASSTHFASFILGLELLGISLYALISWPAKGLLSLEAALKYLILSGMSSAFILFGIALLFAALGTLSFHQLAALDWPASGSGHYYLLAALSMILAGLMFKLSLVPFHIWTPDVYEGAPAPVAAFVATVSKGAIFVVLLRFFVLTEAYQYQSVVLGLSIVAIASMLVGNLLALMQTDVKRILAYSSIAHLGYLMVAFIAGGVAGGTALAIEAASYFLIAYFITTLGAFAVVTVMSIDSHDRDSSDLSHYEGLFWRKPVLATTFTAMMLSLAGIPLTVGFIGKFYIFAAGVQGSLWLLLGAVIVGSGIGLFYYLRIIFTMTMKSDGAHPAIPMPVAGSCVVLILTLMLLALGVYPTPVIEMVNTVTETLVS